MSLGLLITMAQLAKMSVGHSIPLASVELLTPLSVGIVLIPRTYYKIRRMFYFDMYF